jgi:glycosyltransferase involved in cell wall biosynthesis
VPTAFDFTVVVACYDEEPALPRLFDELGRLEELARGRGLASEFVMVDDGSADGTLALLRIWAAESPGRTVVAHPENRGFGAAMRTGFAAARGRAVVSYDADATYPVADVLVLLAALGNADVAGASPFAAEGEARASPARTALSKGVAALYRLALRDRSGGLTAYTCAFRAYRREILRGFTWRADGFLAAAEVISLLLLRGARVVEVPSLLTKRIHGVSKMKFARTAAAHLSMLADISLRRGRFGRAG